MQSQESTNTTPRHLQRSVEHSAATCNRKPRLQTAVGESNEADYTHTCEGHAKEMIKQLEDSPMMVIVRLDDDP
jgi:hypothetical protein